MSHPQLPKAPNDALVTETRARVLASLSRTRFSGEEEREVGFTEALRQRYPLLQAVDASDGLGLHAATEWGQSRRCTLCLRFRW